MVLLKFDMGVVLHLDATHKQGIMTCRPYLFNNIII
jgi:hypothetical protein